jgi:predicted DNA-binding transcriptional regulator YafY
VKAGFDLQPLMFSADEIDALVIGMRMVQAWSGPQLASSGAAALAKVTLALPKDKRDFVEATALFAPSFHIDPEQGERLESIRQAIARRNKLQLQYTDASDKTSQRTI